MTVDEFAHVPAGVSQWERGTFSLYRENPPLIRSLTAFPVWLAKPRTDYSRERIGPGERSEWAVGQDFAYANADRYLEMVAQARLVVVLLGIACGALIFHWARELHGGPAAVVRAFLWLFDPSVLAHSGVATVDVGAATVGLLATYWFWKFLQQPSWHRLLLAGAGLGLAQASKFTMLALYPAWTAMALVRGLRPDGRPGVGGSRAVQALRVCTIFLLSLVVLNACYLFRGSWTPLGDFRFISAALRGGHSQVGSESPATNRFGGSVLGSLPVPLPRDYVLGFDSQKHEEEGGHANLVAGKLERRGNLLSPLITLLYKLPFGTIALLAGAGAAAMWRACRCRCFPLDRGGIIVPGVFLIAVLCSQTGPFVIHEVAMKSMMRFVEFASACTVLALFGVASGLGYGSWAKAARPGLVPDEEAAAIFGGICTQVGGINCQPNNHVCSTTMPPACPSTTCSLVAPGGSQCIKQQFLITPSTYPCDKYLYGGNCCASVSNNCVPTIAGGASWSPISGYYCSDSNCGASGGNCGEPLYTQLPCRT